MRPTIEPSTALGLPRRSWWRSGSSSMRSSSIASRSAGATGVANGSTPGLERLVAQQPRAEALEGRDRQLLVGGRPSRSSIRSRSASAAGREHEDASRRRRAPRAARPARRSARRARSSCRCRRRRGRAAGRRACSTASCWAAESTSDTVGYAARWTPDWLGAVAAGGRRRCARCSPSTRRSPSGWWRPARAARAATARSRSTPRPSAPCSPSSSACTTPARASPSSARSAGPSTTAATGTLVVVDPIDGSLNAKRGLPTTRSRSRSPRARRWPTSCSASCYDFGPDEEWVAERGARRDARRRARSTRRSASAAARDGKLELVGIESADPRWVRDAADALVETTPPAARDGHDRRDAVPGRRRAARRHGHAARAAARSTPPRAS